MIIKESAENYLEAIYILTKQNGNVRGIDVATYLGVSKPSVSVAMKSFREEGYVITDENGNLSLTDAGMAIANKMYERHHLIAKVLIALGVDEETAYEDSCKIEHHISDTIFNKIKEYFEKNRK